MGNGGPAAARSTGLYPSPSAIRLVRRWRMRCGGWPRQASPSTVQAITALSSALLRDPDGNGVELYRDRPREEGRVAPTDPAPVTRPLDLESPRAAAVDEVPLTTQPAQPKHRGL